MQGKVEICGVNTSRLKTLSQTEMDTLLRLARAGDEKARQRLIEGNLRLVLSVIQRFDKRGESPDDLFQVGCIGLMKAIANFDPDKQVHRHRSSRQRHRTRRPYASRRNRRRWDTGAPLRHEARQVAQESPERHARAARSAASRPHHTPSDPSARQYLYIRSIHPQKLYLRRCPLSRRFSDAR